ncbi:uncharacterized protein LOC122251361 [Penaeus japonicus]|uniref:uncharacterized protein LOC122251361 n=1 Tax=Penaeus japonicus TaxID=27405 RepID=UPI001C70B550|nr:uncharacterized protein LOC122251361 [Penaeus japonicus]
MSSTTFAPIAYQLQQGLPNVDLKSFLSSFDPKALVKKLDLQTAGLVALVVVSVVFLVHLFAKSLAPFGKSLLSSAAHAWDSADQWGLGAIRQSQSLAPVTKVLDAMTEAAKKWEEPESAVRYRSF